MSTKTPTRVQRLETGRAFANYVKDQPGVVVEKEDNCGITFRANGQRVRMSNDTYPLNGHEKALRIRTLSKLGLLAFAVPFLCMSIFGLGILLG